MTPGTEILRARALAERQPVILPPEGTRNGDPFCKVYPQEPGIRVWVSAAMYVRQVDSVKNACFGSRQTGADGMHAVSKIL